MERNSTNAAAKVSLIVPVYNTKDCLFACVESLITQTHANLELLFIDDGSTDGSAAILDAFAKEDPRVRVLHKPNGGVSAARNDGIDMATGDFIGFVDSDDSVEPTYCETLLRAFSDHPEIGVSICNRFIHGHPNGQTQGKTLGAGRVLSARDAAYFAVSIGKSYEGYLWNKLFSASIFREQGFRLDPSLHICEDLLLCTEIFASGQSAYYDTTPLYHYNYRESGALRTFDEKRMSEFAARERVEAIIRDTFDAPALHAAELSHVKSALNILAAAKQSHNRPLAAAMKQRIDVRKKALLKAPDIPGSEKVKLRLRRLAPVLSMRVFLRHINRR